MELIICDLATLRYQWVAHRTRLQAVTARGEFLAAVDVRAGVDEREAAFLACDAALGRGWVRRDGRRLRVGLYNPYSAEVAVGALPDTAVFADQAPVALPVDGAVAVLDDGAEPAIVLGDGRRLPRQARTYASYTRAVNAHRPG